ncbi:unnamed protein product, partial [Larinioides sclopetarius]
DFQIFRCSRPSVHPRYVLTVSQLCYCLCHIDTVLTVVILICLTRGLCIVAY